MNRQPLYRWLEQQGEAFGTPGMAPRWTSSVKDAVCTAYAASSRIWFTCSHGILNQIYNPTIDKAQVRDMGFLITDGETFVHEENAICNLRLNTSITNPWVCATSTATPKTATRSPKRSSATHTIRWFDACAP